MGISVKCWEAPPHLLGPLPAIKTALKLSQTPPLFIAFRTLRWSVYSHHSACIAVFPESERTGMICPHVSVNVEKLMINWNACLFQYNWKRTISCIDMKSLPGQLQTSYQPDSWRHLSLGFLFYVIEVKQVTKVTSKRIKTSCFSWWNRGLRTIS